MTKEQAQREFDELIAKNGFTLAGRTSDTGTPLYHRVWKKTVQIAVEAGRKENPKLHLGICGEHGGDPRTVKFLNRVGLDYVSCSPFRVPQARLAAAQAVVEQKEK